MKPPAKQPNDDDLKAEIEAHLAESVDDLIERGFSAGQASLQSRRQFGNVTRVQERSREAWRVLWFDRLHQDVAFAIRSMRKNPLFTLTAVLCLSLGIGANTAIFTVVQKVLLARLPYADSDRIVVIGRQGNNSTESPLRYAYWSWSDHGFEDFSAFEPRNTTLAGREPEMVKVLAATAGYFPLFGARANAGRVFGKDEDRPGAGRYAVLSHALWQRHFGGDNSIVGRSLVLGGEPYVVTGIMASDFVPYPEADIWVPLQPEPESTNAASTLTVVGRLPSGETLTAANVRMRAVASRFAASGLAYPAGADKVQVARLQDQVGANIRPLLLLLMGAVGAVLLVACVNVANLLLARAASRHKEIAIRAAIGAGRGRLIRQLLTESTILSLLGGATGLVVGKFALAGLLAAMPEAVPRAAELTASSMVDPWIAGFSMLLSLCTGLLFGLAPALRGAGVSVHEVMKDAGSSLSGGRLRDRALRVFTVAEIAMALVLLLASLLLVRSSVAMHGLPTGFDASQVVAMEISLAGKRYLRSTDVDRFERQLTDRIATLPDVESVAVASSLPLYGKMDMIFTIPGRQPDSERNFTGDVQWRFVTPRYFETLRIPIVAGRALALQEPRPAVVISQTMARRFWPGANPIGQMIVVGGGLGPEFETGLCEIVGISGDVRERLTSPGGDSIMYLGAGRIPDRVMALTNRLESAAVLVKVRSRASVARIGERVREELRAADPLLAARVRTLEDAQSDSIPEQRFHLAVFGSFALLAGFLAAIGIYGVTAYGVEQRTREIGIRAAVGCTRLGLVNWILREVFVTSALGIMVGLLLSAGLARLMTSLLFGVVPLDAVSFSLAALFTLCIALAAGLIPAIRASQVDPLTSLRA